MMSQSYSKAFVKDNAIVIAGHILINMKGIILMPLIIKTVGVKVYGGFVLLSSVFGIVIGISSFGAGFRAKRFMPSAKDMQARRDLFYPQFLFRMFSIFFFSIILILFDKQFKLYIFKNEISYLAIIIPIYLISYFLYSQGSDYFRYTSRINYMTVASVCYPYAHIGLVLLFYSFYNYISIDVLVLSQTLSALLVVFPFFWIIFQEIGIKLSYYTFKNLVSDIKLGFPLVLGFIVDFILAGVDRYFIAFYLSVSAVGYYNPGYVLGSLIIFLPKAMYIVISVLMSKAVDNKNKQEAQRLLNYTFKIFLLLAIPYVFGSVIMGRSVLIVIGNIQIAELAWPVIPIVALGSLFCGLSFLFSSILFVQQKTAEMFKVNLLAALFNLLANSILLYFFRDIIVAGITTLMSYFIGYTYVYRIATKDWHIDFNFATIIKSVIASLIMVVMLFLISDNRGEMQPSGLRIAGEVVLGIITYIGGLFVLKTFTKKELQFVISLIDR